MDSTQTSPLPAPAEPQLFAFEDHSNIHETLPDGKEVSVWMVPGKLVELPYDVHLGTQYIEDRPVLRCYIGLDRRQDLKFNDNRQIDLSGSINLVITLLATRHHPVSGHPVATLVAIGRPSRVPA